MSGDTESSSRYSRRRHRHRKNKKSSSRSSTSETETSENYPGYQSVDLSSSVVTDTSSTTYPEKRHRHRSEKSDVESRKGKKKHRCRSRHRLPTTDSSEVESTTETRSKNRRRHRHQSEKSEVDTTTSDKSSRKEKRRERRRETSETDSARDGRRRKRREKKEREARKVEKARKIAEEKRIREEKHRDVYMPRSKYYPDPDVPTTDSMSYITDQQQNEKNDHIECRSYYVGPMTAKLAAKSVKPNHFIIYYQLPDDKNPIPYRLRLYLAYKGQSEEVFHFPIVCGTNQRTGDPSWSLRHADSATFPTLADMIKYHRTYAYMDPGTGKVETFPIWKNVLIDCDDID